MPKAARKRAYELLAESERLERELVVLIEGLTAFTEDLQGQLRAAQDETVGGGEHGGPGTDGGAVR